jgi:2-(1,2-epoxy-1,2-dihydrophenyl)acetyl-CoA isomerase
MQDDFVVEQVGSVAIIRLDRPALLNALRMDTFVRLQEAYKRCEADEKTRVIVLTGTGRAFCAGADLRELATLLDAGTAATRDRSVDNVQELTRVIAASKKITIAALNGFAVGFGAEIPLACDIRIAVAQSYIAFPEVTRGLSQTNGSFYFLPRMIGTARALDLLLSGDRVSTELAYQMGLVTRIFEAENFHTETLGFATQLSAQAPISVAKIKEALNAPTPWTLAEALAFEARGMLEVLASADLAEGVAAFHEKRSPVFTGH